MAREFNIDNVLAAQRVFALTSKLYKGGYGSHNKHFEEGSTGFFRTILKYNKAATTLDSYRTDERGLDGIMDYLKAFYDDIPEEDHISIGKRAVAMNVKAANCGELASIACYYAQEIGVARKSIQYVSLEGFDHGFCMLASDKVVKRIDDKQLRSLKLLLKSNEAWIIDVWSGLCCPADQYSELISLKFETWTRHNVRILWSRSGASAWVPPSGAYLNAMMVAQLDIYSHW